MTTNVLPGSAPSVLGRRGLIAGAAAAATAAAFGRPRRAAAQPANRDVLVVVSLWGGADGLVLCPPVGDPDYARLRPALQLDPGRYEPAITENLDGFFGLHQMMSALAPVYRAGDLAFVHTVAHPDTSRSHFDAQRLIELGRTSFGQEQWGWVGRHLQSTGAFNSAQPLRAIGWNSSLPTTLFGGPKTIPLQPGSAPNFFGGPSPQFRTMLDNDYSVLNVAPATVLAQGHREMNASLSMLQAQYSGTNPIRADQTTLSTLGYKLDVSMSFASALHVTAELVRRDLGVEVVMVQGADGWDSHDSAVHNGLFNNTYGGPISLARNLAAFYNETRDLNVTTVVVSEFGRTAALNSAGGTDHGRGGVMMVMGKNVAGGQVIGRATWPGLAASKLHEGRELPLVFDVRDVFGEILRKRMATTNMTTVFPDHQPIERGVIG